VSDELGQSEADRRLDRIEKKLDAAIASASVRAPIPWGAVVAIASLVAVIAITIGSSASRISSGQSYNSARLDALRDRLQAHEATKGHPEAREAIARSETDIEWLTYLEKTRLEGMRFDSLERRIDDLKGASP
jgi:hypothetical protein